jgi:hypothetical protein
VDVGIRTPLLDFFRRGEVARDIRLLAAQGALAPRAHEQLALLVLLVDDADPEIARAADATIAAIPTAPLAAFLARTDASAELRAFFAARGIEPAAIAATDVEAPLIDTGPELASLEPDVTQVAAQDGDATERTSTVEKVASLTILQKMNLAMKGTREERLILIRDPNKIVAVAVLSSPKLTETEVESIAKMSSVSDEILRIIANTRAWVKSYQVVVALTRNPKTPVALSMNLLSRLVERDLRMLSQDRNIPDILRITARKKLVMG